MRGHGFKRINKRKHQNCHNPVNLNLTPNNSALQSTPMGRRDVERRIIRASFSTPEARMFSYSNFTYFHNLWFTLKIRILPFCEDAIQMQSPMANIFTGITREIRGAAS